MKKLKNEYLGIYTTIKMAFYLMVIMFFVFIALELSKFIANILK
jgi:hypothetical protein